MTFEKDSALKAGGGDYISETGCYVGDIAAKAVTAKSGSLGVELSIKTDSGLTGNYITIYFQKSDGSRINSGFNHLQSMMGLLKVGNLAQPVDDGNGDYLIKEFCSKKLGLALQKRLYSKNDGSDGYDFQLRAVFDPVTNQTYKEKSEGTEAKKIKLLSETMKDQDERNQSQAGRSQPSQQSESYDDFDF